MLHSDYYNPRVISWVSELQGIFKVTNTVDFAQTWGRMKSNRSEEMNYEKVSRFVAVVGAVVLVSEWPNNQTCPGLV